MKRCILRLPRRPRLSRLRMLALWLPLLLWLGPPLEAQQPPDYTPIDLTEVAKVVGPPAAPRLAGEALEAEAKRVSAVLRCPVCQGLSVGDSPSTMATHMRQEVRDLVAAGFTEEQVLSYFEASYGEFVRLQPPLRGVNWLVWLAPVAGLVLGIFVVFWLVRGAGTAGASRGAAASESAADPVGGASADADAAAEDAAGESSREADTLGAPAAAGGPDRDRLPADPALASAVLRVRETAYGWPGGRRPESS